MQKNNTPENGSSLEEEFDAVRQTLAHLTRSLRAVEKEVAAGEDAAVREASKLLADIRTWSRLAIDMEVRFEERRKQQEGIATDHAVNLARARSTIRCRLDRLRRCCGAGEISR
ncbi:hypothetical protein [Cognatishimia maritima]|uniref:Uncharacterized protein n=1 Tax=Cognatishimia maritima TaxID=870908 RepID=A0A1M5JJL2_9RHOB|nr:hypothetical protein [Cognatishimia maritima]SHG40449.1 hypothetical protein SAMN04488044_0676 [Cognatishimia maritima]